MEALSILFIFFSFFLGYHKTSQALWISVILYPLLNPANFAIIPSSILYLNIDRIVFAILLGVYFRKRGTLNWKILWKNSFIKIFLVFSLYLILISLEDRLKQIFFTDIPNLFIMILLGYTFVRTEENYKALIKILSWQSAFFGVVVLFDYFNILNLSLVVRQLSPTFNEDFAQIGIVRAGVSRVAGWDGNSIPSAQRIAVLVPIILLNIRFNSRENPIFKYLPFFLSILSIVLLMSRSVYIAFVSSILFLIYFSSKIIEKNVLKKFLVGLRTSILALIIITSVYMLSPDINMVVNKMYDYSFSNEAEKDIQGRQDRIPYAFEKFLDKPITGYGSPQYTYYKIMNTDDLPLFVLYLLSGGIPLFILLILWWYRMPFYFLKFSKFSFLSKNDKYIIVYVSSAFVAGLIPMLSNWNIKPLGLMFIIWGATYKYILIRNSNFFNLINENTSSRNSS
jgi:hypothetical protein